MTELENEYVSLIFVPMPHLGGDIPPSVTCLYTDGICTYWTGWYDRVERAVLVQNERARPPHHFYRDFIPEREIKYWSKLPNFMAVTKPYCEQ